MPLKASQVTELAVARLVSCGLQLPSLEALPALGRFTDTVFLQIESQTLHQRRGHYTLHCGDLEPNRTISRAACAARSDSSGEAANLDLYVKPWISFPKYIFIVGTITDIPIPPIFAQLLPAPSPGLHDTVVWDRGLCIYVL